MKKIYLITVLKHKKVNYLKGIVIKFFQDITQKFNFSDQKFAINLELNHFYLLLCCDHRIKTKEYNDGHKLFRHSDIRISTGLRNSNHWGSLGKRFRKALSLSTLFGKFFIFHFIVMSHAFGAQSK